jgi:hypothetical protein
MAVVDAMSGDADLSVLLISLEMLSLEDVPRSFVFKEDFDGGQVLAFVKRFEVEDSFSLFELFRRYPVECPEYSVEQRGLADTVFGMQECDIPLRGHGEHELVFAVELAEVVEVNL